MRHCAEKRVSQPCSRAFGKGPGSPRTDASLPQSRHLYGPPRPICLLPARYPTDPPSCGTKRATPHIALALARSCRGHSMIDRLPLLRTLLSISTAVYYSTPTPLQDRREQLPALPYHPCE